MIVIFKMDNGDSVSVTGHTVQEIFDLVNEMDNPSTAILHFIDEHRIIPWSHVVWVDSIG